MNGLGDDKAKFEECYQHAQSHKILLATEQRQFRDEAWETCGRISSFLMKGAYADNSAQHRIGPIFRK